MRGSSLQGVARFLYTHNPFYLISTGLVLYGLQSVYGEMDVNDPMLLGIAILLYILISIAKTSWGKHWGKHWGKQKCQALFEGRQRQTNPEP